MSEQYRRTETTERRRTGDSEYSGRREGTGTSRRRKQKQPLIPTWLLVAVLAVFILICILIAANGNTDTVDYSKVSTAEHIPITPTTEPTGWGKVDDSAETVVQDLGNRALVLPKTDGMTLTVTEDDYIHHKVVMTLTGLTGDTFSDDNFQAVVNGEYYEKLSDWTTDVPFTAMDYAVADAGDGTYTNTITITEATVYEWRVSEDSSHFYISIYLPKELYNCIVVIDAGHGGEDSGCIYQDTYEKTVTLEYTEAIHAIANTQSEIKYYFTRTTSDNLDSDYGTALQMRPDFANEIEADLFLSIHMNANDSTKRNGSAVYYNEYMDNLDYSSKDFATELLDATVAALGLKKDTIEGAAETLSITKYAKMPVALLEVGFFSNESDFAVITNADNIQKEAKAITEVIRNAFVEMGKLQ